MDQFGSSNTNDLQKAIDELNSGASGGDASSAAGGADANGGADNAAAGASGDIAGNASGDTSSSANSGGDAGASGDASGDANNGGDVNAIKDTFGIPPAPAIGGAFPVDSGESAGAATEGGADAASDTGVNGAGDSGAGENKEEKSGAFGIGSMDANVSASIDSAISSIGEPTNDSSNATEGSEAATGSTAEAAGSVAETTPSENSAAETPAVEAASPEASSEVSGDLVNVKKDALKELVPLLDKTELSDEKKFEVYEDVINDEHDKAMIPKALEAARKIGDEKAKAEALLKVIRWIDAA